eukprot:14281844-Alexandrium_andersonii.AAC.1
MLAVKGLLQRLLSGGLSNGAIQSWKLEQGVQQAMLASPKLMGEWSMAKLVKNLSLHISSIMGMVRDLKAGEISCFGLS